MMDDEDTDKDIIEDNIAYALHLILKTKYKFEHNEVMSEELEKAEVALENFLEIWRWIAKKN
jgi:hypothetical protein